MSYFGSTEWFTKVAEGLVPGYSFDGRWGRNASVGNTHEPIISASMGGAFWTPTAASTVQVRAGGNVNDDIAGTGARTISITGLNEDYDTVKEIISLAGVSASAPTTITFTRLHRASVESTGTYGGANAGEIIIEATTGSITAMTIDDYNGGEGRSLFCVLSTPRNHSVWLLQLYYSADTTKTNDVRFLIHDDISKVVAPFASTRVILEFEGIKNSLGFNTTAPIRLNDPDDLSPRDLWITGAVSAGTAPVSAGLLFLLKDESIAP